MWAQRLRARSRTPRQPCSAAHNHTASPHPQQFPSHPGISDAPLPLHPRPSPAPHLLWHLLRAQAYSFLERKRDQAKAGCDLEQAPGCADLERLNDMTHQLLCTGSVSVPWPGPILHIPPVPGLCLAWAGAGAGAQLWSCTASTSAAATAALPPVRVQHSCSSGVALLRRQPTPPPGLPL